MIKEVKSILMHDYKKYVSLVEHSEGENQEIFEEVARFLENLIETK